MTFLRNMKIRGKLFGGFFLVLAITVFICDRQALAITRQRPNRQNQGKHFLAGKVSFELQGLERHRIICDTAWLPRGLAKIGIKRHTSIVQRRTSLWGRAPFLFILLRRASCPEKCIRYSRFLSATRQGITRRSYRTRRMSVFTRTPPMPSAIPSAMRSTVLDTSVKTDHNMNILERGSPLEEAAW